jgi:hypothetical protein
VVEFLKSLDWAIFLYIFGGYVAGIIVEKRIGREDPRAIDEAKKTYVKNLERQIESYEKMESNWDKSLSIHKDIIQLKDDIIRELRRVNEKQEVLLRDQSEHIGKLADKLNKCGGKDENI